MGPNSEGNACQDASNIYIHTRFPVEHLTPMCAKICIKSMRTLTRSPKPEKFAQDMVILALRCCRRWLCCRARTPVNEGAIHEDRNATYVDFWPLSLRQNCG